MQELLLYMDTIYVPPLNTPPMAKINFDIPKLEDDQLFKFNNTSIKPWDADSKIVEVLNVQARAKLMTTKKTYIGEMFLSPRIFRNQHYDAWEWLLNPNDIAKIEKVRQEDFYFDLIVNAVIIVEKQGKIMISSITGRTHLTIPKSDWLRDLELLGYKTFHTLDVFDSISDDHSWNISSSKLKNARLLLRQGYTHRALEECLSVFESYIDPTERSTGAYRKEAWNGLVENFSPQKQEGLKLMLSGVCSYLNKIGHHRETSIQDENGLIPNVSADQYEAEIMLSVTQMLVTYVERIRKSNP